MTSKQIIRDPLQLQQISNPARPEDRQAIQDLTDTLLANKDKAAGLAANMIGINKQILALFIGPLPYIMINPVVLKKSGPYQAKESCLSLDGERKTTRYQTIIVKYQSSDFASQSQQFSGFTTEVIQHEMDHFKGKLI
jgi:peptide deformylase